MSLNIIFMGTPNFAVSILRSIHQSQHKILSVFTQPPRKKDRGQKINISPIHQFSNDNHINLRCPENLDTEDEYKFLKDTNPDVVVVVAFGKIIPSRFLNLPKTIFINIHASLLPKWRGAAPIQRAIMNLDKVTGISIMKIVSKLDSGPVMLQSKLDISKDDNQESLSKKLSELGSVKILEALNLIENKSVNFVDQKENEATYAKKISKDEAKINCNKKASEIIAKIKALYPNPGSWFELSGVRIKILKAEEIDLQAKPGIIVDKKFTIGCAEKAVRILELKKEGKKEMTTEEFLKGNEINLGQNLN